MKISILWGSLTNPIYRGGMFGQLADLMGEGLSKKGGGVDTPMYTMRVLFFSFPDLQAAHKYKNLRQKMKLGNEI